MSTFHLFLTVYFAITYPDGHVYTENPAYIFLVLWLTMPLQLFMAIFGEIILIPMFLMGIAGLLVILLN